MKASPNHRCPTSRMIKRTYYGIQCRRVVITIAEKFECCQHTYHAGCTFVTKAENRRSIVQAVAVRGGSKCHKMSFFKLLMGQKFKIHVFYTNNPILRLSLELLNITCNFSFKVVNWLSFIFSFH